MLFLHINCILFRVLYELSEFFLVFGDSFDLKYYELPNSRTFILTIFLQPWWQSKFHDPGFLSIINKNSLFFELVIQIVLFLNWCQMGIVHRRQNCVDLLLILFLLFDMHIAFSIKLSRLFIYFTPTLEFIIFLEYSDVILALLFGSIELLFVFIHFPEHVWVFLISSIRNLY